MGTKSKVAKPFLISNIDTHAIITCMNIAYSLAGGKLEVVQQAYDEAVAEAKKIVDRHAKGDRK